MRNPAARPRRHPTLRRHVVTFACILLATACGRRTEQPRPTEAQLTAGATSIYVTLFPLPPGVAPGALAAGADGNLWFPDSANHKMGRITPTGQVTEFPLLPDAAPYDVALGPDQNIWFTDSNLGTGRMGRITPSGVVTNWTVQNSWRGEDIVGGTDGAVWYIETGSGFITRLTPEGVATRFNPTPPSKPNIGPMGITAGPGGTVWFTAGQPNQIVRMDGTGARTEFNIPTYNSQPDAIATGSDGNFWFTERRLGKIGRITPAGIITEFLAPSGANYLGAIAAGPEGNIWFTEWTKVGRITPAGVITEFALPSGISVAYALASGADHNLWFCLLKTDGTYSIGRIAQGPAPPANFSIYVASASQVNLSWNDIATDETGYRVERSLDGEHFSPIATLPAGSKSFSNVGLTAAPTYYYRVCAFKGSGDSDFTNVLSTRLVAPDAPSALTANIAGSTTVNLSWKRNATYGSTYQVERMPSGGTFAALGGAVADASTYSATGSTYYKTSSFRVYAQNGLGKSAASATITPTTCSPTNPLSCDDGNPCTADVCDATVGCKHTTLADGIACSDGDLCTQSDVCQAGVCRGSPLVCDPMDNCGPSCNPTSGTCDYRPATTNCINPVSVKVVDASGVAQAGVAVSAYNRDTFMSSLAVANPTVTDASGVASIALPRGNYRFLAQVGGHSYWSDSIGSCRVPECVTATIRLVPVVYVSVKYADGAVAAGAQVVAMNGNAVVSASPAAANADGIATVTVPAGSYRFSVKPDVIGFYSGTTNHCTVPTCTSASIEINRPVTVVAAGPSGAGTTNMHVFAYQAGQVVGTEVVTAADPETGQVAAKLSLPSGAYRFRTLVGSQQYWSSSTDSCVVPGCTVASIDLPTDCANGVCPQLLVRPCSQFPSLCGAQDDGYFQGTHVYASTDQGSIYHGLLSPADDGTWKQPLAADPLLTPWRFSSCPAEIRDLAVHNQGNDQVLLALVASRPCHAGADFFTCQCNAADPEEVHLWEMTTRAGVVQGFQDLTHTFNDLTFRDIDLAALGTAGQSLFCGVSADNRTWLATRDPSGIWWPLLDVERGAHAQLPGEHTAVSCQGQNTSVYRPSLAVVAGGRVYGAFVELLELGFGPCPSCVNPNMGVATPGFDDLTARLGLGSNFSSVSIAAMDHDPHLHLLAGFQFLSSGGLGIFEKHAMIGDPRDTTTWGTPSADGTWTIGATNLIAATGVRSATIRPVQGNMELLNVRAFDLLRAKYDGQSWSTPQTIAGPPGAGSSFTHVALVEEVRRPNAATHVTLGQDYCDYLINWDDADDIELGYHVYAQAYGSPDSTLVASIPAIAGGSTGARISQLQLAPGRYYKFWVAPYGVAGDGPLTLAGAANTTPIPAAPKIVETYGTTETSWYLTPTHPDLVGSPWETHIFAYRLLLADTVRIFDSGPVPFGKQDWVFGSPGAEGSDGHSTSSPAETVDVGRDSYEFRVRVSAGIGSNTAKWCARYSEATLTTPRARGGFADPNAHPAVGSCCFDDPNDPGEE